MRGKMIGIVASVVVALSVGGGVAWAQKPVGVKPLTVAGAKKASETITQKGLKDYLTFIASDALEGRNTPSQGQRVAAQFIAYNLARWGVKPGGDNGTYFQNVPIPRRNRPQAEEAPEPVVPEVAYNVVGIIEGSDPKLKAEYVAVGAHYDHVGVGKPNDKGDAIYNGADDDGSGTVAVLAMAEALATSLERPKRSVIFVWHTGEEKGLWGSRHFTDNPTVPIKSIVTQLNIDMIGRSKPAGDTNPANAELTGPNEMYAVGSSKLSKQLGDLLVQVNKANYKLALNYKYDAPDDSTRIYYRSDHYNYARKGIPIIFFFDGVHEDYHQQGDEVSKIDFVKMTKITRTVYLLTMEVANRPNRPVVDKPVE